MKRMTGISEKGFPGAAAYSDDERCRLSLERELGGHRVLGVIGLNPSTATHIKDDQTIAKEIGFATRWGCGRLVKGNLYGFRARNPKDMWAARKNGYDITGGRENDEELVRIAKAVCETGGVFLAAWGTNAEEEQVRHVLKVLRDGGITLAFECLGLNKDWSPKHPVYLSYETPLERWTPHARLLNKQLAIDEGPQCDFRDAHDAATDTPTRNRCDAAATHMIEWADGRYSFGCSDHLTIDKAATVKPARFVPIGRKHGDAAEAQ